MRSINLCALALAAVLPAGAAGAPAAAATRPPTTVTCTFTPTPDNPPARPVDPPPALAPATGTVEATLRTNHGDIALRLDRTHAPCAVHSLAHLAASTFYDRSRCWRLTTSARLGVLQCGDIWEAEVGGPGYRFADELTGAETYPRATVAMGNQGKDTNGSQFFLVHSVAQIRPEYTVLGVVTDGLDVLDRIAAAGTKDGTPDGQPKLPVEIRRAVLGPQAP
ncbi:peptidyl-prolyl cis-trans isomerase [Pilimelia terevasa]|uniref:Peptidyl-prolyl cis-trans isomerase n=1 Tax=Pilimelia terevasa TaxID=53372 RepID=A0A8J3FI46_9ACTN|nr:peptidylprolyl isomerase [Pilimelia terevasa]GGK31147.1 peptidyl-prolyl cis-trans isomerase [Pilimelia terevasa]